MSNLLILHGSRTIGPYTLEEARSYLDNGALAETTPAWTEGLTDWSTVGAVLGLLRERATSSSTPPEFTDVAQRNLLPDGVRGFCWGAFLVGPIWSIGNRVWVGLLCMVPGLGQLVGLWLGFNGRELSWRKGGWRDLAHFQQVQRRWTMAGLIFVTMLATAALFIFIRPELFPTLVKPGASKEKKLTLPLQRSDFERVFKDRTTAEIRAMLGKPAGEQQDKAKNTVYFYIKVTLQPGTQVPDDATAIIFVNDRAAKFEYLKQKSQTGTADQPASPPAQGGAESPPPARNAPREEHLTLPMQRSDLERVFMNRSVADVRTVLGKPLYEKGDPAKNALIYVYRRITLQPNTQMPDDMTLIIFVNGRVAKCEYMQEKRQ